MPEVERRVKAGVDEIKGTSLSPSDQSSPPTNHGLSNAEFDRLVADALRVYDSDKTGMFDFALESAGGTIVSTRCTDPHTPHSAVYSIMGVPIWWENASPRAILQPGSSPGQCWAFKGSQVRLPPFIVWLLIIKTRPLFIRLYAISRDLL